MTIAALVTWRRAIVSVALAITVLTLASCGATHAASTTTILNGWKLVSYQGVHLDVPAGWPVVDGMHTLLCGGPFPAAPTVFVGPQENALPTCGPPINTSADRSSARNGVWLQPGVAPSDAPSSTTSSGQVIQEEEQDTPLGPTLKLVWFHGVFVEIGIGTNPNLAKEIFNTIGFTSQAPDTKATRVCARSAHPDAMPTPELLVTPLVLHNGGVTLDPPLPSDRQTVSAAQVWSKFGAKESTERYRLLFTRYSAALPARQNANGSLTPSYHDELAWVIYAAPYSADIAGCGDWGAVVFDALSGQEVISSSWSPGP